MREHSDALHYAVQAVSTRPTVSSAPRLAKIFLVTIDVSNWPDSRHDSEIAWGRGNTDAQCSNPRTMCGVSKSFWRKAENP